MSEVIKKNGRTYLRASGVAVTDLKTLAQAAVQFTSRLEDEHWDQHVQPMLEKDPELFRLRAEYHEAMRAAAVALRSVARS
ncbi:hypothetical protein [Paenirhodobacter populi]|uniref:Uncharacterized protein n=1 Tax=Paenirhodobacter populi TaxID=2306993 RepID=A0A443IPM5_9RHOB|nr:hypothetical protein [Sinirhodobacter populi]RWR08518.1 hypothetical protein D2T33_15595 [Sinirhodobacter populi]